MDIIEQLEDFRPQHDFFIGIDSDGTAFDAMGIKHKKAFIPMAVKVWKLERIEKEFYEVAEFVNLYSNLRGVNRFPGLLLTFDYLQERWDVRDKGVKLPDFTELGEFVNSGMTMSNASLLEFAKGKNSSFLSELIEWSMGGDKLFTQHVKGLKPFQCVEESLKEANRYADLMVISAASSAGLKKDWGEAGILNYMTLVAGQEAEGKDKQLEYATSGKYHKNKVLMIGDAPGDMKAAKANSALFYPINPGNEVTSWQRFCSEALERFISGCYEGEFEDQLIKEFLELLPEKKPWS